MSKKDEALKLALEALKYHVEQTRPIYRTSEAITAIREALAEQPAQQCGYPYCGCNSKAWCKLERMAENARELGLDYEAAQQQEPVGEAYLCDKCQTPFDGAYYCPECGHNTATKESVYTSPQPSKPWVGLTDEEWQEIDASLNGKRDLARIFTRAIEAKLKEKNT